jgi:hypothetical protein
VILVWCSLAPSALSQEASSGRSWRTKAFTAAQVVIDAAGHRLTTPLYLWVELDTMDAVAGGFSEALNDAGFTPRLGSPEGTQGSILRVRRLEPDSAEAGAFDVRIERLPERSVVYSRIITAGQRSPSDEEGILAGLVVPAALLGAAALIIYLLFTVRS